MGEFRVNGILPLKWLGKSVPINLKSPLYISTHNTTHLQLHCKLCRRWHKNGSNAIIHEAHCTRNKQGDSREKASGNSLSFELNAPARRFRSSGAEDDEDGISDEISVWLTNAFKGKTTLQYLWSRNFNFPDQQTWHGCCLVMHSHNSRPFWLPTLLLEYQVASSVIGTPPLLHYHCFFYLSIYSFQQ